MKRYAILLAALPLLFLVACVPYYYADYPGTYESAPPMVSVPVLPPLVVLDARPYYTYGGYYYYWDADRGYWLYTRSNRGPWYQLPRTHYPERFQYKGRWHERGKGPDRDRDGDRDRGRERGR